MPDVVCEFLNLKMFEKSKIKLNALVYDFYLLSLLNTLGVSLFSTVCIHE